VNELPRGTVTFLFTDVEGSTRLLQEHGDGYAVLLAEHRRLLREAFVRHDGFEVDTQGDAFFVAFARASDALTAAAEAQEALLTASPVRVRMGLHTGEPLATEEGYVGMDVHRAARVAAAGHGGQVLVSQATRDVAGADSLRDLGEHRLKDLAAPERIYQLGDGVFPPLKTLYRTNLPVVASALVGRERELEEAGSLVRAHRMLTLTGPGGSGKTRLAIHLAANAAEDFPDGVYWVPLQAVRDPAIVERAIAAAVGADDGLIPYVGSRAMLILLDNFEQVIDAATVVSTLIESTPNAKVLVTSREPLHIGCEQRYPIEPLRAEEAELLFAERARAVVARFRSTPEVAAICERLDRLPLAIELAAARVALLDPAALLARLDQRLPLLASRARDAPARQRTLRATIEWSYELLEAEEQQLFGRLAIFRGSFSLEAAEAICYADLDALEALVVKNLVRRRWETGRLLLLDTIREYAFDRLAQSPDADEIHRRHAEFFLSLARTANLNAGDLAPGGQRLEVALEEQDNFRTALAWALRRGEMALGLELATALEQFWVSIDPSEGVRWFRALLEHEGAETVSPAVRAHALRALGSSTHIGGDLPEAGRLWEQSLGLFEDLDDDHGRAVLLHRLSIAALLSGDLGRARKLVESSHDLHSRNENWWRRTWGHAQTTGTRGAIARDIGDEQLARELLSESAALANAAGVAWWRAGMLAELAAMSLREQALDAAERHARESLVLTEHLHDRSGQVFGLGLLACVAAARREHRRAGRLWGAIESRTAFAPLGGWARHRDECAARMLDAVGAEFEAGLVAGRSLELDEAVEEALKGPRVGSR
jgi:predicted ATPase